MLRKNLNPNPQGIRNPKQHLSESAIQCKESAKYSGVRIRRFFVGLPSLLCTYAECGENCLNTVYM